MRSKTLRTLVLVPAAVTVLSIAGWSEASEGAATSGVFQLTQRIESGEAKEVSVLLDEDHLKPATIILRGGTELPTHSTPVPATILVLEGSGVIHVVDRAVSVAKGSLIVLAAGDDHDVVPAEGTDMLLLVHYLRGAHHDSSKLEADHHH